MGGVNIFFKIFYFKTCLLASLFLSYTKRKNKIVMRNLMLLGIVILFQSSSPAPSPDSVYAEIVRNGLQHPEIVLAQAILETGWFKCNGCSLNSNNLFGLYDSRCKEYFYYENWKESIKGYKRGIQYKYDPSKHKDYYHFLKDVGYASDPYYIDKVKKIVELIKGNEYQYICLR